MTTTPHELILASAGTGKTYRLSNRFLRLLFEGVEPERILATTFTRKAAGEILDRVLERLVEASDDEQEASELRGALGISGIDKKRSRALLARLTRQLDTFQVRTIDSFFVHLVQLFALDLELTPDWRIVEDREDHELRSEAMQDVLRDSSGEELLVLLRELAKGGASRLVHQKMLQVAEEMRPSFLESAPEAWDSLQIPAGPSEEELKGAVEALERVEVPQTKQGKPAKAWVTALENLRLQIAAGDWEKLLASRLCTALFEDPPLFSKAAFPPDLEAALHTIIARARHELMLQFRSRNLAALALLETFEEVYQGRKRSEGAYRFEDLPLALAPRTAKVMPLDERELDLWFRLDGRIDHLLLDEFQDTAPVQWRILEPLAREIVADGSGERSFFCVGDVKQSIYAFRQAEPRLLGELSDMLPGLEAEKMDESYRSSQVVLDTVNHIFGDLEANPRFGAPDKEPYRTAARQWSAGFAAHSAAKDLPGCAFVVEARQPAEEEDAFSAILERTVERVVRVLEEVPQAEVGILMRKRKEIPRLIHALRKRAVQASGEGGNALTDARAVLVYLSLLHLTDHPEDTAAEFHVAHSPFGEYTGLAPRAPRDTRLEVARELRRRLVAEGLGEVTRSFASQVEADAAWSSWDKTRFAQLLEIAYAFEAKIGLRPSLFVEQIRTQRVEAPGGAAVRVMTVHASKGLEFDVVILPELAGGFADKRNTLMTDRPQPDSLIETVTRSPSNKLLGVSDQLRELYDKTTTRMVEDALCTLYVATTRAARRLELVVPWSDPDKTENVPRFASFLRAALGPHGLGAADEEGVLWAHPGNALGGAWGAGLETHEKPESTESAGSLPLGLAPTTVARHLTRRSPSRARDSEATTIDAAALLRSRVGSERGTLVHAWLESLEWIEDWVFDRDELLAHRFASRMGAERSEQALELLRTALESEAIQKTLARASCAAPEGSDLVVEREARFSSLLTDDSGREELWTGSIDRLVIAKCEGEIRWAEILDYKTDRVSAGELGQVAEQYRPQLERYRQVVALRTGLTEASIPIRLVFLAAGETLTLS